MKFTTFEEIEAWQEARLLVQKIRLFCDKARAKHDWTWCDQILSAGLSIMANIAEGNDALSDAEFIQFLGYSKRSAGEVRSHLYYGLDAGYVTQEEFKDSSNQASKISAQTASLIKYLRSHSRSVRSDTTTSRN